MGSSDDLWAGLGPDDTLQLSPDLSVVTSRPMSPERLDLKRVDELDGEPGPPVAVIASVGHRLPAGGVLKVGSWALDLVKDQELLACAEDPSKWAGADALVLYICPLNKPVAAGAAPAGSRPLASGYGPRKTRWRSLGGPPPGEVLTDGTRAVALRVEGSRVVMDWYHAEPGPVFGDLDKMFKAGDVDHAWVILRRGKLTGGKWYAARPTPFDLTAG